MINLLEKLKGLKKNSKKMDEVFWYDPDPEEIPDHLSMFELQEKLRNISGILSLKFGLSLKQTIYGFEVIKKGDK